MSWEDIANEVAPIGVRSGGLATGAWRGSVVDGGVPRADPIRIVGCPPHDPWASFDSLFEGREVQCEHGTHYAIARHAVDYDTGCHGLVDGLQRLVGTKHLRGLAVDDVTELCFVDIETTGLSGNVPLFLIGLLRVRDCGRAWVELFLARDLDEEAGAVAAFLCCARGKTLVTFNGKSFDWPYIAGRGRRHRIRFEEPRRHVDVLHLARRAWRGSTPNCRLQTLEYYKCGRRREGDIPSARIPDRYYQFLNLQEKARPRQRWHGAHLLAPIIHHNVWDILTTAELLCLLHESAEEIGRLAHQPVAAPEPPPPADQPVPITVHPPIVLPAPLALPAPSSIATHMGLRPAPAMQYPIAQVAE